MRGDRSRDELLLFRPFILVFSLLTLLPFLLVLSGSFTDEVTLIHDGYRLWPRRFSLDAYRVALNSSSILSSYAVTVSITLGGTALSLLSTAAAAFALSGSYLKYRRLISFYFYFTMLFSGGLVPSYILISKYLQLRNTLWVYILPIMINPWNLFLLRNFFNMIHKSLIESAMIDGAHHIQIFFGIVLPLSPPSLATIGLFYALNYWNIWMESMLYIDREELQTLQYLIMKIIRNIAASRQFSSESGIVLPTPPGYSLRLATALLTIGPVVLFYPFLQKYFTRGIIVGAVKE